MCFWVFSTSIDVICIPVFLFLFFCTHSEAFVMGNQFIIMIIIPEQHFRCQNSMCMQHVIVHYYIKDRIQYVCFTSVIDLKK